VSQVAEELLARLRARDVQLRVEAGRLRVNAPAHVLTPELEAELRASKEALLELLEPASAPPQATVPMSATIPRATSPLPLSFVQQGIWLHGQLERANTAYNLAMLSPVRRDIANLTLLVDAIGDVIGVHEILRSRYVVRETAPVVELGAAAATPIVTVDLRELPATAQQSTLEAAAETAARAPFDLAIEAPVRFTVFQVDANAYVILTAVHHIAADAWSLGILDTAIVHAVAARTRGGRLAAPRLQYADYAQWQRTIIDGPEATASLDYWVARLAGLPKSSTFVPDRSRSPASPAHGASWSFVLPVAPFDRLRTMVRSLNGTVYMALVATVAAVLARHTGQTDLAIGSPFGIRETMELEEMLGPVLNALVLRLDLSDDPSFATLFARARDAVLDAHEHRNVPFDRLLQSLHPTRTAGQSPLFQIAAILHNVPADGETRVFSGGTVYDVTLNAHEENGALHCGIEYRSDLFDESTIRRIARHLEVLLTAALRAPNAPLSTLDMLPPEEVAELLAFNPPPVALDIRTVVEQFETVAATDPDRIAVIAGDESLTYRALALQSARVVAALTAAGVTRGSTVGLLTHRSPDMLVALLGILRAGAACVPIGSDCPAERVSFMLRDAGCVQLLATRAALAMTQYSSQPLTPLLIDSILEGEAAAVAEAGAGDRPSSSDLAYVMYTPGPAGTPIGVEVPHSCLSNLVGAMRYASVVNKDDAVLAATPLSSDRSMVETLLPLVTGARIIVASSDDLTDQARMAALIRRTLPTVMQLTSSAWRALLESGWEGGASVVAIAGGEPLTGELARRLRAKVGTVCNADGPTETTGYASMSSDVPADGSVSVGRPLANTSFYVLDAHGRVAPTGGIGEVHVGGAGVARGYHNRDALTFQRFTLDPFASTAGARMYRTGDLGRWRADGELEFLGRRDRQLTFRGHRIEPGEVESALASHAAVHATVVGVREWAEGDPRLVAWVVLRNTMTSTGTELRRHLRISLPEYMVPSMVSFLEAFPRTVQGEIDRALLPDPFAVGRAVPVADPPRTRTEVMIAGVWQRLLGVAPASCAEMFFELGGYSLLAMRAAHEISDQTGTQVDPRTLFFRNLGDIAAACDAAAGIAARVRP